MRVNDVTLATPTMLRFYADVDSLRRGVECVTWAQRADGAIVRRVDRLDFTGRCSANGGSWEPFSGASPLSSSVLMPPTAKDAAEKPPAPFRYRLLVQPDVNDIDPGACTTVEPPAGTSLNPLQRNQLIGVEFNVRAILSRRGSSGDQAQETGASLASRQMLTYRYALGCAQ
jgi:hypothetical protein